MRTCTRSTAQSYAAMLSILFLVLPVSIWSSPVEDEQESSYIVCDERYIDPQYPNILEEESDDFISQGDTKLTWRSKLIDLGDTFKSHHVVQNNGARDVWFSWREAGIFVGFRNPLPANSAVFQFDRSDMLSDFRVNHEATIDFFENVEQATAVQKTNTKVRGGSICRIEQSKEPSIVIGIQIEITADGDTNYGLFSMVPEDSIMIVVSNELFGIDDTVIQEDDDLSMVSVGDLLDEWELAELTRNFGPSIVDHDFVMIQGGQRMLPLIGDCIKGVSPVMVFDSNGLLFAGRLGF